MKKVLALVLAVAMVSTLAFAWDAATESSANLTYRHSTTAGSGVNIDQKTKKEDLAKSLRSVFAYNSDVENATSMTWDEDRQVVDSSVSTFDNGDDDEDIAMASLWTKDNPEFDIDDMLFRAVTTDNYTVTNIKVVTGRSLLQNPAVSINNGKERVQLNFVKDLNNTTAKNFDVTFTLKGKGKMVLNGSKEAQRYNEYMQLKDGNLRKDGQTVTIPTVRFKLAGTVGYGKVTVNLGDYTGEDLEDLSGQPTVKDDPNDDYLVNFQDDVITFKTGKSGELGELTRQAGSYTADAILTEHYGELTMEARVYSGDTLYLYVDNDPDRELLGRLADVNGDVDFFFFEQSSPSHVTLNSNAKLIFDDTEEGDYVYNYINGKLQPVGEYDEDEGCMVVKTRKLGQYITSGHELVELEIIGSDDIENPDTGANDVVGIAAALAAVALVSAAAVSLKK